MNYDARDETHVRPQVAFRLKVGAYDPPAFFRDLCRLVPDFHDSFLLDPRDGEVPGTIRFDWNASRIDVDQAADYLRSLPFVVAVFPGYGRPIHTD